MREQQEGLHGHDTGCSYAPVSDTSLEDKFLWSPNNLTAHQCWSSGYDQQVVDGPSTDVQGKPMTFSTLPACLTSEVGGYGTSGFFAEDRQGSPDQLVDILPTSLPSGSPTCRTAATSGSASFGGNVAKPAVDWPGFPGVRSDLLGSYANARAPFVLHPDYGNAQGTSSGPPSFFGHYHWREPEVPMSFKLRKATSRSSKELSAPLDLQFQYIASSTPRFGMPDGSTLLTAGYQTLPRGAANSGDINVSPENPKISTLNKNTNEEVLALMRAPLDTPTAPSERCNDSPAPKTSLIRTTTRGRAKSKPSPSTSRAKAATPKKKKSRKSRSPAARKLVDPKAVLPIIRKASKPTASLKCEHCEDMFSHKRSLQKHEKLHGRTAETQPECQNCDVKFSRPDALVRHVRDLYENDPEDGCVKMAQRLGWRYKVRGTGNKLLKN